MKQRILGKNLTVSALGLGCIGLGHGFGLGTGTVAEGWLDQAVAFWQKQIDKA